MMQLTSNPVTALAHTAPLSPNRWDRFFAALRQEISLDRTCLWLFMDRNTGIVLRLAQTPEVQARFAGESLYEDRKDSKLSAVIAGGEPTLVHADEWSHYPDLMSYWPSLQSNLMFPLSLGGWPAVWNLWSTQPRQYSAAHVQRLQPLALELSRSPFQFDPAPVRLAIRQMLALKGLQPCRMKSSPAWGAVGGSSGHPGTAFGERS
jgi:hypothetical protein